MADITKHIANKIIAWAFTIGIIIAIVLGLISKLMGGEFTGVLMSILIVLGIVVGFFNITRSEAKDYILFVTAMVIVIALGGNILGEVVMIGEYLSSILNAIMAFMLPAVIIVAIKSILNLAKD